MKSGQACRPKGSPLKASGLGRRVNSAWKIIQEGVRQHAFAGAVALVLVNGYPLLKGGYGYRTLYPRRELMTVDSIFDIASLTKPVATTTAVMLLVEEQKISLGMKVSDLVPTFAGKKKDRVTVKHLLSHTSGLPSWRDLYTKYRSKESVINKICMGVDLESPPGLRAVYSDLGFILLGEIVEKASGQSLHRFLRERIFSPLGMNDTGFNPELSRRMVATEFSNWKFRFMRGEVHDENAFAMGGVSGHAGLFSTAEDLAVFCQMILNHGKNGKERLLGEKTIRLMTKNHTASLDSYYGLGWWLKTKKTPDVGEKLSYSSFGHNGYTGTSIWLDPQRKLSIILLTNRIHPARYGDTASDESVGIMMKRPASWGIVQRSFHDAILDAVSVQ
jgi:CubicO group peptidase (beta-lactamase class C family)